VEQRQLQARQILVAVAAEAVLQAALGKQAAPAS